MTYETQKKILIICGPTASGKSDLAMRFAEQNNGEIINADSSQIYKEIPILSCSPTEEDKKKIPHHLYNHKPLSEKYSVAKFINEAKIAAESVVERGKIPIIVGGTGLYVKALIEGVNIIPEIPKIVRIEAQKLLSSLGNEKFHEKLGRLDPIAGQKLHPSNSQRLIRAYEVLSHTKKSIYDFHNEETNSPLIDYDLEVVIVTADREKLYKKCNDRFSHLIKIGALDEVKKIMDKYNPDDVKSIGYKEIYQYLKREISKEKMIELASQKTRNYAKRQITFFKHQIKGREIDMDMINEEDFRLYLPQ